MKKLIVTAMIAMLGIVVNAASVEWSAYPICDMGTTTPNASYLVYFFDSADLSTSAATTKLGAGDTSFVTSGYESYGGDSGFFMGAGSDSYGNGVTITGYLVVFNAATLPDATYAFVSGTESGTTGASGQAAAISFDDAALSGMSVASNWTSLSGAEPIPEPTSGLLLLVGGALLALKRRRA